MNRAHYIAGDWGTSRLRLSLCQGDRVVETRQGPGWREAPYLPCPANLRALGGAAIRFEADGVPVVAYLSGLIPASSLDGEQCALAGLRTLWQP